jgi:3D (Asp-Asp-Asp) domain-containing protein
MFPQSGTTLPAIYESKLRMAFPSILKLNAPTLRPGGRKGEFMKCLITAVGFALLLTHTAAGREESVVARVTVYWRGEGSQVLAGWNGARLRAGDCAVDPRKIPYGSKVVFDDAACNAVDTGAAVVSRRAARLCGRTASERNALVIDRFFESKQRALSWVNAHPHFMSVKIVSRDSQSHPLPAIENAFAKTTPLPPKAGSRDGTEISRRSDSARRRSTSNSNPARGAIVVAKFISSRDPTQNISESFRRN